MTCWSCHAAVAPDDAFCPACRKIQPEPRGEDCFAALGLPRAYALDPDELERRYRERSRQLHPDRFARATPRERRISLERSTRLNDAYRALRDRRARATYLLKLSGLDPTVAAGEQHDPEFLEEQLELRETLALARESGDRAALARIAAGARDRLGALDEEVARLLSPQQPGPEALHAVALALVRARYFENVVEEADPAAPGPHP